MAGDKAFLWEAEFAEVFEQSGFDIILGNPPYVTSRDNAFNKDEKGLNVGISGGKEVNQKVWNENTNYIFDLKS